MEENSTGLSKQVECSNSLEDEWSRLKTITGRGNEDAKTRERHRRRELNIFATGLGESVFSRSVCQKLSKTYCSHDRSTR